MNVHDLPSNVGSWFLTDSDCAQYCRRLSPTMYEFTQIVWLDTTVDTDKTYCVTQSVEDVGDMTLDEISGHISSYYQTLSKMVESYGGTPFIEENMDPRNHFKYVREPNILSMSFEGTLYDILNTHDMFALQDLFSKYGLYYECGNAWNLSAYPIDE